MKTEKLIGAVLTIVFTVFAVSLASKFGSSAGKKAAEQRRGDSVPPVNENGKTSIPGTLFGRQEDKGKQIILASNMRQIGFAMSSFELRFGNFPNFQLNKVLEEKGDYPALLDPDYLFSQLLASNVMQSKEFLETPSGSSGEWLYFGHELNSKSKSTEVILISPEVGGKVGILRLDNSVKLLLPEDANKLTIEIKSSPIRIPQRH